MSNPPHSKEQKDQQASLKAFNGTVQQYFEGWQPLFAGVLDPRNPLLVI